MTRGRRVLRALAVAAVTLCLFAASDRALTATGAWGWIFFRQDPREPAWRVRHPLWHHGLAPNRDVRDVWGATPYRLRTNSLGFRDGAVRTVSRRRSGCRVLLLGDSFTEGVGVEWAQTFAGRLTAASRCEVLTAAASSWSPSIYRARIEALLADGYELDRVIAFVDVSDVQDEAVAYERDARGHVVDRPGADAELDRVDHLSVKRALRERWLGAWQLLAAVDRLTAGPLTPRARPFNPRRSAWTYDLASVGYGPRGASFGVARAVDEMRALHELLSRRGVGLSVAVYPWPAQLVHDRVDSRQVRVWRGFCDGRCERFVDLFPAFFDAAAGRAPSSWYPSLYLRGDVHFSPAGHRLVADRVLAEARSLFAPSP